MKYAEHRVRGTLAGRVECIWLAEDPGAGPSTPERVLPDGCIEWIFHFGAPYADGSGGDRRLQPASLVVGPTTSPIAIAATGPVETLGVRFRPGGARGLLPAGAIAGGSATPAELWGAEGGRVEDEVRNRSSLADRVSSLEAFLENRLRRRSDGAGLAAAVAWVLARRGRAPISAVADAIGWSRRKLEREFRDGVGLSPKALSRVARFQNVLRLSARLTGASWADLAARCGYADQAHLVREFRALSGTTPASGDPARGDLARHFVDPARLEELLSPPVAFVQDAGGTVS